ncbi:MAG: hypothetical protein CVV58_07720, partial [Tenericutes bacterium HGW-Tenericutes-3]
MRKLMYIIVLLSVLLSGCFNIIEEEDTDEYRALASQYESFITSDIVEVDQFEAFVNEATFNSMMSNVMIKVSIYTRLHNLVGTRYGSGVIFATGAYNYVLTTFDLTDVSSEYIVTYQIADYQGRTSNAYKDVVSEEYGLAVLRFVRILSNHLPGIGFADQEPIMGEPILLFGYIGEVMNSMSMGLMDRTSVEDEISDKYMKTTIPSDVFANGAAIVNTSNELIG